MNKTACLESGYLLLIDLQTIVPFNIDVFQQPESFVNGPETPKKN